MPDINELSAAADRAAKLHALVDAAEKAGVPCPVIRDLLQRTITDAEALGAGSPGGE